MRYPRTGDKEMEEGQRMGVLRHKGPAYSVEMVGGLEEAGLSGPGKPPAKAETKHRREQPGIQLVWEIVSHDLASPLKVC